MEIFNRIGFNIGLPGNATGYGDYIKALDAAGVPAVTASLAEEGCGDITAVWDAGSTVPHLAVVRSLTHNDVPRYDMSPADAVQDWLKRYVPAIGNHVKKYPTRYVTKHGNELSRDRIQWLAEFYTLLHPALLQKMGWSQHRICVFNFASGDPGYDNWESILPFLKLVGENPDKYIIGVHEYSYSDTDIFNLYPYLIGRVWSHLYDVCDDNGIKRPYTFSHELGWRDIKIPATLSLAMKDVDAMMTMYAEKCGEYWLGGGLWTLKEWQNSGIQHEVQKLITPITQLSLTKKYTVGDIPMSNNCPAIVDVKTVSIWIPNFSRLTDEEKIQCLDWAENGFVDNFGNHTSGEHMLCPSHVDALRIVSEGLPGSIIAVAYPERVGTGVTDEWFRQNCPCVFEDRKQVVYLKKTAVNSIDVPIQSQRNPLWASNILGFGPKTIGNFGCLLTDYSMLLNYWKVTTRQVDAENPYFKARGGFAPGTSDLVSLALTKVYPQIRNEGWLSVGTAMHTKTRDYLARGIPVVAKVDFHPETAQWDQHWVLLTGYDPQKNDYLMNDPWTGKKNVYVNDYYYNGGLQGCIYYLPPTTGEYSYTGENVLYRPLIEAPADDWRWPAVKGMIDSLKIGVKFKSHGTNANYYSHYSSTHDFLPVRLFFTATNYVPPATLYKDTWKGQIQNFYNRGARDFELFNEPNIEGIGVFWNNGTEYGQYMEQVCQFIKTDFPSIRLWFTAMSPGVPFTNQYAWIDKAWPILNQYCYGFCTHCYTGNNTSENVAIDEIISQINATRTRYNLQKPLFLSEVSVNRGLDYAQKARVYKTLEIELRGMAGIKASSFFISDWYSPPASQKDNGESWYGTSLPQYYLSLP